MHTDGANDREKLVRFSKFRSIIIKSACQSAQPVTKTVSWLMVILKMISKNLILKTPCLFEFFDV